MSRQRSRKRRPRPDANDSSGVAFNTVSPLPADVLDAAEWEALVEAMHSRPPKAIRLRHVGAHGLAEPLPTPFATEPIPWFEWGRFATSENRPGQYLHHAAGAYYIQDAASQLALKLLAVQPGERIADVCASPGGKASAILEIVGPGGGFLLANESIRNRVPALAWNLARVGYPRYAVTNLDPELLAQQLSGSFDGVLVDAPCTGQTLVGRGKQKALAFSTDQVLHAAARQRRILEAAAQLVRAGGRLVYSTCTFAVEENEDVIGNFLCDNNHWHAEPVMGLSRWASGREPGGYRLYPHRDGCAGAYSILLRHKATNAVSEDSNAMAVEPSEWQAVQVGDEIVGEMAGSTLMEHRQRITALPTGESELLRGVECEGLEISYQPKKQWMPSHALALRRDAAWRPARTIDLDDSDAVRFMRGETLPAAGVGWCVVRWRGHPLGWVRMNAMRGNNGLPPAARLPFAPVVG